MKSKGDRWFRLKIFLWYILTEPFRQLFILFKQLFINPFKIIYKWVNKQNKNMIWAYVASVFLGISLAINNKFSAAITFAVILLIILIIEYDKGYFMYRYRQHYKTRLRKRAKKMGLQKDYYDQRKDSLKKK